MSTELDQILDSGSEDVCPFCDGDGCDECNDYVFDYCTTCGGENGEHEPGCPEDNSPYALLVNEGYD